MKILIFGGGVIGSVYAAKLHEAGVDVALFARGRRLEDIQKNGIVLKHYFTGKSTVTHVKVIDSLDENRDYDLIIIIIRGDQWQDALTVLTRCKNTKTFLFVGNNPRDPDELIDALGKDRVMLGFGGVAGYREGHTIHYCDSDAEDKKKNHFCIGELDGRETERCRQIRDIFGKAGYPVWIFKDAVSWLKSHMIVIMPIMGLLHMAGWEQKAVVKDTQSIKLGIRAFREMVRAFKVLKVPVDPKKFVFFSKVPMFLMVPLIKKALASKGAEIGIFGHANSASGQTEMKSLAYEFTDLLRQSSVPLPAWEKMMEYIKRGSAEG
ncbi:MAG: ketopantoate reductase family protein [Spirochaetales bacterium]|nr:ketopantoate reductase family protein [Spirochaetales bacterium]